MICNHIRIVPEWNVNLVIILVTFTLFVIRIVPEWNVNIIVILLSQNTLFIRIVPEWNVNDSEQIEYALLLI